MNQLENHNVTSSTSIFRRWSNKAYAVFNSIGRVVHIGFISSIVSGLKTIRTLLDQRFYGPAETVLSPRDILLEEGEVLDVKANSDFQLSSFEFSLKKVKVAPGVPTFSSTQYFIIYSAKALIGLFYFDTLLFPCLMVGDNCFEPFSHV